jgi:DNA-binding transcriptional LysR family regulator
MFSRTYADLLLIGPPAGTVRRPMDVNTRRLRHFAALAEQLNFSRAATILHISQQGLSRSIAELEQQVGAPLLVRTTRSVALTEAGEAFLRRLRPVLDALDDAVAAARNAHSEVAGRLRVGFTVSSAVELAAPILRAFRSRYPAVVIELETFQWSDPSCGLRSNTTDVAFVRMPIEFPNLRSETMFVEPRAIGVDRSHPLAASRTVTLSDLTAERIIAPRTDDATWRRFWTLRDTGLDDEELPEIGSVAGSMEEELETVTFGQAVTITAISMSRFTPRPSIVFRPIIDIPGSELVLAWRGAGTALTEAFRATAVAVRDEESDLVARIEAASGYPDEF